MRSHKWRYTAWLRVVGYKQSKKEDLSWQHNKLIVNWTYPPYFEELFDHRQEAVDNERGRIYFGENVNTAYDTPTVSSDHFKIMKDIFDNGLLPQTANV